MATIVKHVISNTFIRYRVYLGAIFDSSTGETLVEKIDLQDLTVNMDGLHPKSLALESCEATINGLDSVTIYWDRNPSAEPMIILPQGRSELKFDKYLEDPKSDQTLSTGNILLSTNGTVTAQDSYSIYLSFTLRR